jgi:hypothetical protein
MNYVRVVSILKSYAEGTALSNTSVNLHSSIYGDQCVIFRLHTYHAITATKPCTSG